MRTAAVTMSPLVVDLITTLLSDHARITLVARLAERADIETTLPAAAPQLVLVGLRRGESQAIAHALRRLLPMAMTVALSSDGRAAAVYVAHAAPVTLRDFSPHALVEAILGGATGLRF